MFSLQAEKQGYGWNIQADQENARIYRGGLRGSFQSMLGHYPKENALLIFGLNKNVSEIVSLWLGVAWNNLENIILGKAYVLPPAVTATNPADLHRYVGEYELASGERFVTWVESNALHVAAQGQAAVNFLVQPQQVPPGDQAAIGEAGKQLAAWLSKNDVDRIKASGYLTEKDLPVLHAKWTAWMNAIGGLRSIQLLGVSPGSSHYHPRH